MQGSYLWDAVQHQEQHIGPPQTIAGKTGGQIRGLGLRRQGCVLTCAASIACMQAVRRPARIYSPMAV